MVAAVVETAVLANDLKEDGFTVVSLHPVRRDISLSLALCIMSSIAIACILCVLPCCIWCYVYMFCMMACKQGSSQLCPSTHDAEMQSSQCCMG